MRERCTFTKQNGERCGAAALQGESLCFFHSPRAEGRRQAARQRGGRERSRKAAVLAPDTPDAPLATAQDAGQLLARTANQVLRGEVDPRIANAVGYLCSVFLRAAEMGDLEARIAALEQRQKP